MSYLKDNDERVRAIVPCGCEFNVSHGDINCEVVWRDKCETHRLAYWRKMSDDCEFVLVVLRPTPVTMGHMAIRRMMSVAHDTGAVMLYSDRYTILDDGNITRNPVIDYQQGSLRDDFDFGSVIMIRADALRQAVSMATADFGACAYAGFYAVRLALSRIGSIEHVPELLYTDRLLDNRSSGERIFDYQRPEAKGAQREIEEVCTSHLIDVGAYLPPEQYSDVDLSEGDFAVECSVIIPVLNRVHVIEDAIKSVLSQETPFEFNLIIVDNHSTDGTSQLIEGYSKVDRRVVHIIPDRNDLGIGGCWNVGIYDSRCGRFAIGLDSDDLYACPNVLARMVAAFHEQNAAMVVGSYMIVNDEMEEIPPGKIAHNEWTLDNGRNNLLHVNGIGGPRAFFTPIYRRVCLPPTSYGEDYAMVLMISRHYRIGRVWDVMSLARRGNDNTDSHLDITLENANNTYKDRTRTWELMARIALNKHRDEK